MPGPFQSLAMLLQSLVAATTVTAANTTPLAATTVTATALAARPLAATTVTATTRVTPPLAATTAATTATTPPAAPPARVSTAPMSAIAAAPSTISPASFLSASSAASTAARPDACDLPQHHEFDFWIGEWNVTNRWKRRQAPLAQWPDVGTATTQVHAVVGGCAIVEHWRGFLGQTLVVGFSIRAYNPITDDWDLVLLWPQPNSTSFSLLHGDFRHGRGEFFSRGENAQGGETLTRYSFSDITDHSLRWDDAYSEDEGRTWQHTWIMEFSRRDAADVPLFTNAAAVKNFRCDGEAFRASDDWIGHWSGSAAIDGDSVQATLESVPILGGCATMDIVRAGHHEAFSIRAYESASGDWVEWSIDSRSPVLHELRAEGTGELSVLEGTLPTETGEASRRVTRQLGSDGQATITLEESSDGGRTWAVVHTLTLERRI